MTDQFQTVAEKQKTCVNCSEMYTWTLNISQGRHRAVQFTIIKRTIIELQTIVKLTWKKGDYGDPDKPTNKNW